MILQYICSNYTFNRRFATSHFIHILTNIWYSQLFQFLVFMCGECCLIAAFICNFLITGAVEQMFIDYLFYLSCELSVHNFFSFFHQMFVFLLICRNVSYISCFLVFCIANIFSHSVAYLSNFTHGMVSNKEVLYIDGVRFITFYFMSSSFDDFFRKSLSFLHYAFKYISEHLFMFQALFQTLENMLVKKKLQEKQKINT